MKNLAELTSIQIGGVAADFFEPVSAVEIAALLANYRDAVIVGGGTNLVFGEMSRRAVISLRKYSRDWRIIDGFSANESASIVLDIDAAVPLAGVVEWTLARGWGGLENLIGIPGTVGGAVTMNAGTPRGAIGERVREITAFNRQTQQVEILKSSQLNFAYRRSLLQDGAYVLLSARMVLTRESPEILRARVKNLAARRLSAKIKFPNCGSVFKNPAGEMSAGELLDRCGLKNAVAGKLRISPTHANFFENLGGAVFADFIALRDLARRAVAEKFQIQLELEVKIFSD